MLIFSKSKRREIRDEDEKQAREIESWGRGGEDSESQLWIPPAAEHPHIVAVRDATVQFALGKKEVLEKVIVITRTTTGVVKRVRINNPN
jgi:hypothetical protein